MGANSILGLLFQISADPSQAQAAVSQFESGIGKSFTNAAGATKPLNDAILSNRESVRLLSEETGIHLPRAVTHAIAEMLPQIANLGAALLAVFAVKEVVAFGEELVKVGRELDGAADAEKRLTEAGKENYQLLEKAAEKNSAFAYQQIQLVRIQVAQLTLQKDHLQNIYDNEVKYLGWFGKKGEDWIGDTDRLKAKQNELTGALKLQDDLIRILGEDEDKAHQKAAKDADAEAREQKRRSEQYLRQLHRELAAELAAHEQRQKYGQGQTPDQQKEYQFTQQLYAQKTRWEKDWARLVEQDAKQEAAALKDVQKVMRQMPIDLSALGGSLSQQLPKFSTWHATLGQTKDALKDMTSAMGQSTVAMMVQGMAAGESFGKVAKAAISSIAEQAGIQAIWEAAQGVAMLALSFFTGNPKDADSADAHFLAAKIYGTIGGVAAGAAAAIHGGSRGGGGAGGGSQSRYGRDSSGSGSGGSGGGGATPGGGGVVHIHMYFPNGTLISPDTLPQVMAQMSTLSKSGQAVLTSTNALYNGEKLG